MTERGDKLKIGAVTFSTGSDDDLSSDLLLATSHEAQEAGLDAIREAWKQPISITQREATTLRQHHRQGHTLAGHGAHFKTRWKGRRKVRVWRIPGLGGADLELESPPSGRAVAVAVEVHRKLLAKGYRAARLILMNKRRVGVRAHQEAALATREAVLSMLANGRRVYTIASELGITKHHVRRIRRAATKADITEKG